MERTEQSYGQMNGLHIIVWHPYQVCRHDSVNHSIEFVIPGGVHVQNAESYWNRVKIKLKSMRGVHEHQLAGYLDEFMYRERYGQTARQCFDSTIHDIATQYQV